MMRSPAAGARCLVNGNGTRYYLQMMLAKSVSGPAREALVEPQKLESRNLLFLAEQLPNPVDLMEDYGETNLHYSMYDARE